jgi:hypothetical protein
VGLYLIRDFTGLSFPIILKPAYIAAIPIGTFMRKM